MALSLLSLALFLVALWPSFLCLGLPLVVSGFVLVSAFVESAALLSHIRQLFIILFYNLYALDELIPRFAPTVVDLINGCFHDSYDGRRCQNVGARLGKINDIFAPQFEMATTTLDKLPGRDHLLKP